MQEHNKNTPNLSLNAHQFNYTEAYRLIYNGII